MKANRTTTCNRLGLKVSLLQIAFKLVSKKADSWSGSGRTNRRRLVIRSNNFDQEERSFDQYQYSLDEQAVNYNNNNNNNNYDSTCDCGCLISSSRIKVNHNYRIPRIMVTENGSSPQANGPTISVRFQLKNNETLDLALNQSLLIEQYQGTKLANLIESRMKQKRDSQATITVPLVKFDSNVFRQLINSLVLSPQKPEFLAFETRDEWNECLSQCEELGLSELASHCRVKLNQEAEAHRRPEPVKRGAATGKDNNHNQSKQQKQLTAIRRSLLNGCQVGGSTDTTSDDNDDWNQEESALESLELLLTERILMRRLRSSAKSAIVISTDNMNSKGLGTWFNGLLRHLDSSRLRVFFFGGSVKQQDGLRDSLISLYRHETGFIEKLSFSDLGTNEIEIKNKILIFLFERNQEPKPVGEFSLSAIKTQGDKSFFHDPAVYLLLFMILPILMFYFGGD